MGGYREPLSRLSFGAYLVHPIIIIGVYSTFRAPLSYTVPTLTLFAAGMWTLAHAGALVLYVVVEKPFMNLEMLLWRRLGVMGADKDS